MCIFIDPIEEEIASRDKSNQQLVESINSRDARTKRRHDQIDFRKNTCGSCAYSLKKLGNIGSTTLFCREIVSFEIKDKDPACPKFVPTIKPDEPVY